MRVAEELVARLVDAGDGGVGFEGAVAAFTDAPGKIVAVVEVFEDAAHGFEVGFGEVYLPLLFVGVAG